MKFIRIFFLLAIVLVLNGIAAASKSGGKYSALLKDTIIKLDSIKDRKLLRNNKPQKPGADTLPVQVKSPKDTTLNNTELKEMTTAHADDSTVYDKEAQIGYLYGNARITYGDFELEAD